MPVLFSYILLSAKFSVYNSPIDPASFVKVP